MPSHTRFFRYLALFSYLGLLLWITLWHFAIAPHEAYSTLFVVLMWLVPGLLPLKGILQGHPYTHAWANFILMIYLLHGLTAIYTLKQQWYLAAVETVLALLAFIGCTYYARYRGRELGLGLKKNKQSS